MGAQHTQGPWYWNERHQLISEKLENEKDEWGDPRYAKIIETDGGYYPPHGADRLLISAAPDLLEALKCCWDLGIDSALVPMVRAAIKKAEG